MINIYSSIIILNCQIEKYTGVRKEVLFNFALRFPTGCVHCTVAGGGQAKSYQPTVNNTSIFGLSFIVYNTT